MKTIKIYWLDDCPNCGSTEMDVATSALNINNLHYGDAVTCPQCGKAGEIDCDDGVAFVSWAEPKPCRYCGLVFTDDHNCHSDGQSVGLFVRRSGVWLELVRGDTFEHPDVVPLYAAPQSVPVVPEVLPCPVLLEPGMRFGKGVRTQTMLDALQRRAEYYAELEDMTPEQRAEHEAGIEAFRAMLPQPTPVVPDGLRLALSNAGIAAPESDEMLSAKSEKLIQELVTWVKERKPFQPAPIVPDEMYWQDAPVEGSTRAAAYATGWNACRNVIGATTQLDKNDEPSNR